MPGVERDGVHDAVGRIDAGVIAGRIVEVQRDVVPTVHPAVHQVGGAPVGPGGVKHTHPVFGGGAAVRLGPGQHLEKVGTGDFPQVGSVGEDGHLFAFPVKAEVRIGGRERLFGKMIRQGKGKTTDRARDGLAFLR